MSTEEARKFVLKEFPSAYYDQMMKEIRIYTEGIVLGVGFEALAWKDAAKNIKERK